ncbi:hypothetical protein CCACVL1_00646, partial [Corchorus capsularis]
ETEKNSSMATSHNLKYAKIHHWLMS